MAHPLVLPLGAADGAVRAYRAAGGVVEHVLVSRAAADADTCHRTAADVAVQELGARAGAGPTVRSDPDRAVGEPVDLRAFVGRAYDWDAGRIVSMWGGSPSTGRAKAAADPFMTDGYAEAFSDPPYGMRVDLGRVDGWFAAINRQLLGGLDDDLMVVRWSTDWSTWFDLGHEWWGAFLWTVERDGLPWITAIAASTTD